eukprot:CAMPEP_0174269264 /NCGR_PEP_ID=MMETSP0439-20130205/40412_1 /TAXON_ID=0 /ORGANISM="Stereomyxa ramosa, Strain Chinc5" /LENGTH=82 /DNA_ID=CAMNT_0015357945 /DNA_START=260 /DNA_END=508 /DNA_ORIENTATION=+
MEMKKREIRTADPTEMGLNQDLLYHNRKWRAERNFYLVAFTWTLLVILLRCHAQARKNLKLYDDYVELKKQAEKVNKNKKEN